MNCLLKGKIALIASLATLFTIEAVLSLYTGLPYDMKVWFQTGNWMNAGINIYLPNDHLGYPPLWSLWSLVSYKAYLFFGNNLEIWRLIIKLPAILSHLFLAYFVGKFVSRNFNEKLGTRVFFIVLSWIFIIYIGAMWGQINTISALLTFLAFEAIINKKTTKSAVLLGIAVALKVYPLILLPAFLAYTWMQSGRRKVLKFALWVSAIPGLITLAIFAFYQWDILYFLKTMFYWTPIFETNQPQIKGGGMNIWSFTGLFNIDVSNLWYLRLLWIPILLSGFIIYLLKRRKWEKMDFNLCLITLYILFLASYGWATEQSFIDILPFLIIQVLCFRPKKSHFLLLVGLQAIVFAFSAVNYGGFIFQPFIERFYPPALPTLHALIPTEGSLVWIIRGILGLTFTIYSLAFLLILIRDARTTKPKSVSNSERVPKVYTLGLGSTNKRMDVNRTNEVA